MKTSNKVRKRVRKVALGATRNIPWLRHRIRWGYWERQEQNYNQHAASVEINDKLVLLEAFNGRYFSDSPKALFYEMLNDDRFLDYEFVWVFRGRRVPRNFPECVSFGSEQRIRIVRRGSENYFNAIASAGTIISNMRLPEYIYPKEGQTFVQCWHGTPVKRLGNDISEGKGGALNSADELADRYEMDMKKWTYLLSPSPYTSKHLADAFSLPEERRSSVIIESGYPRNDVLARAVGDEDSKKRAREALRLPEGKKVLLYAPTWRDDSYETGVGYVFDYLLDFDQMLEKLGDEWVVLFRPHYFIANSFDFSKYGKFIANAARIEDVNDLYLASDMLLTDYSSVMFDYAILKRPMALFIPDFDKYNDSIRGFYFPLSEVPGAMCKTTEEVIDAMHAFDSYEKDYGKEHDAFIEKFAPYDDGYASKRVIEQIFPS